MLVRVEFKEPQEIEDHNSGTEAVLNALEKLQLDGVVADYNCEEFDVPAEPCINCGSTAFHLMCGEKPKSQIVREWAKKHGIPMMELKLSAADLDAFIPGSQVVLCNPEDPCRNGGDGFTSYCKNHGGK